MKNTWTLGRKNADITIDKENISRLHAILSFTDGKFYIKDSGSTNGTRIKRDGDFIKLKEKTELFPEDILFFASFEISFKQLLKKTEEIKPNQDTPSKVTIRCKECLNLISNTKPCTFCGSSIHLRS